MDSKLSAKNQRIIIVISEFNEIIIKRLLRGALKAFLYYDGLEKNIKVFRVPGAFEIPGTIYQVLQNHKPDAIVALGAVIRGKTPHFDFVAKESAHGISVISQNIDIPIINGILTTDDVEQALERSHPNGQNKGWDAIESALQTISVYSDIHAAL